MKKRWAAGLLVALPLLWAGLSTPFAWAQGQPARDAGTPPEVPVEEAPAGPEDESLAKMRAVPVAGVPEEGRDAARWALYRGLLSPGEAGDFDGEAPVSRGEAVEALYRLGGSLPAGECPPTGTCRRSGGTPWPGPPPAGSAAAWPGTGSARRRP